MQPLDISFYGPLKKSFYQACRTWTANNPHEKITPDEIGGLFNTAFMEVATTEKAVNGLE
jgi:hypothetical protein